MGNAGPYFTSIDANEAAVILKVKYNLKKKPKIKHYKSKRYDACAPCYRIYW